MSELRGESVVEGNLTVAGNVYAGAIVNPIVYAKCRLPNAHSVSLAASAWSIINYSTVEEDTHGAITTEAAWKFTAPVSGLYQVDAYLLLAQSVFSTTDTPVLGAFVNGTDGRSDYGVHHMVPNASNVYLTVWTNSSIRLQAGDYLQIMGYNNSGTVRAIYNGGGSPTYNFVSIARIGA